MCDQENWIPGTAMHFKDTVLGHSAQTLELRLEPKAFSPPGGQAGQVSSPSEEDTTMCSPFLPKSQQVPGLDADMGRPLEMQVQGGCVGKTMDVFQSF